MRPEWKRRIPVESRCLIQALSWLLPRDYGDRWRREWASEAWHWVARQARGNPYLDTSARIKLLKHVAGCITDVWCLLMHEPFGREKLVSMRHGAFGMSAALVTAIAILSSLCLHPGTVYSSANNQHAALLARRNPFMGKLDRLSPVELNFLSQRSEIFEEVGRWRTHSVHLQHSSATATVLEVDGAAKRLFALRLDAGRWPNGSNGCQIAVRSSAWSRKWVDAGRTLVVNGSPCSVVGSVSSPLPAIPDFMFVTELVPSAAFQNAIVRLRSNVSERSLNKSLAVPFDPARPWLRSGDSLVVLPIETVRTVPLKWGEIVFLSLGIIALLVQKNDSVGARITSLIEIALVLTLTAVPWLGLLGRLSASDLSNLTLIAIIYAYPVFFGSLAAALILRFQKNRCRVCHRCLVSPVRIGQYGSVLAESVGTERVCIDGHGSLFESAAVTPASRWLKWNYR